MASSPALIQLLQRKGIAARAAVTLADRWLVQNDFLLVGFWRD